MYLFHAFSPKHFTTGFLAHLSKGENLETAALELKQTNCVNTEHVEILNKAFAYFTDFTSPKLKHIVGVLK